MTGDSIIGRIGILWRGNAHKPPPARENTMLRGVFDALETHKIAAEPVVFADDVAERVYKQLMALDGVMVWVDPIVKGQDRSRLDAILQKAAAVGVWVSAHPDIILKMGTKEVLFRTRHLGWGTDTRLYRSTDELAKGLAQVLPSGPRVIKQHRGSGGDGTWKVEVVSNSPLTSESYVRVLHALRGSAVEAMRLGEFVRRCQPYFARSGSVIDQPFQARLGEGMVRCYLVQNRVAGFGFQFVKALMPPPPPAAGPEASVVPPRLYYGPEKPEFQALKKKLESEWVPQMQQVLGIATESLPTIWDADFLYGAKTPSGDDTYVLCEINVQGVFPFPEQALEPMARAATEQMLAAKRARRKREA